MRFKDGLYQVNRFDVCAGFVVQNGIVILCAPILRKKFNYWANFAAQVGE